MSAPNDAAIRTHSSPIRGTDPHFLRGVFPGITDGRIFGHEAVGIMEEIGRSARNLRKKRVFVPSIVGCGGGGYWRASYILQCDVGNPDGPDAGTVFLAGPGSRVCLDGLQSEFAMIPFTGANLVKLPEEITTIRYPRPTPRGYQ